MAGANLWQWQFSDAEAKGLKSFDKTPLEFAAVPGWADDDHAAAFAAFRKSCGKLLTDAKEGDRIKPACELATMLPEKLRREDARQFFENNFKPHLVKRPSTGAMLTGYFEPEIKGSLTPTPEYKIPIYALPSDLTLIRQPSDRGTLAADLTAARATAGGLVPYYTRQEIEQGALAGRGLEIAYLADPYDAFVMQVQGSGMIRLPDGKTLRVGFAGKNGHPYSSIGKILVQAGQLQATSASLDQLLTWLRADPERGRQMMWENKSYPFFRVLDPSEAGEGPHGALGLPLMPGRSLAVDPRYHALGTPIWVSAPDMKDAKGKPIARLMVAQDTGSAIRGPVRGDFFFGSGDAAGRSAGVTKHICDFTVLIPN
ncbi:MULTISPECIES: MltA domain-containing protein [Rhodomicrobium]|uniref:murein transglycosylase A n=1 Tax=Rhodomicrobium TaxID=1068 RepID=UPI000B4AAFFD|nr:MULTISPECIES: MltA domain-containing protein [Rhodomicrobium]